MRLLLLLLLAASLAGCSIVRTMRLATPGWSGLQEVTPQLHVEAAADAATRDRLRAAVERARQAVQEAYGGVRSRPVVHACVTEACYRSFGGSTSIARVNGDWILLSPRALDWHFIAHEWSHDELRTRLGVFAWLRVPQWFDEGLAVAVSDAPEHSEAHWEFLERTNVPRPTRDELLALKSLREWLDAVRRYGEPRNVERKARGEPEIRPVYAAAGHEVRPWLRKAGAQGLQALIARVRNGEDFGRAYLATPAAAGA